MAGKPIARSRATYLGRQDADKAAVLTSRQRNFAQAEEWWASEEGQAECARMAAYWTPERIAAYQAKHRRITERLKLMTEREIIDAGFGELLAELGRMR